MATANDAKAHKDYKPPPTSDCQLEGYKQDIRKSLWILSTLILATRAVGAEDEPSLATMAMYKYALAALEPIETRKLRNRKEQQEMAIKIDKIADQIDKLEKTKSEYEDQLEALEDALELLQEEEDTAAAGTAGTDVAMDTVAHTRPPLPPGPVHMAAQPHTAQGVARQPEQAPPVQAQSAAQSKASLHPQAALSSPNANLAYMAYLEEQQRMAQEHWYRMQTAYQQAMAKGSKGGLGNQGFQAYPLGGKGCWAMMPPTGGAPPPPPPPPQTADAMSAAPAAQASREFSPGVKRAGEGGEPDRKYQAVPTEEEIQAMHRAAAAAAEAGAAAPIVMPTAGYPTPMAFPAHSPTQVVHTQEWEEYQARVKAQAIAAADPATQPPQDLEAMEIQHFLKQGLLVDHILRMPYAVIHPRSPEDLKLQTDWLRTNGMERIQGMTIDVTNTAASQAVSQPAGIAPLDEALLAPTAPMEATQKEVVPPISHQSVTA